MPRTDFNGDGRDDIIWRNTQTGVVTNWLGQPDGGFISNEAAGMDPWAVGQLVGIGDLNADGRSDTLWRDVNGGLHSSLTLPDGAFYFIWSTGFVAPLSTDWDVAGTGDFNGDGRSDILLRHGDGWLVQWVTQADESFSAANTWIHPHWQVEATGDFNNDTRDDMLLRHDDGTLVEWLGQPNGSFSSNGAATSWLHPAWDIVGTGDFNGDGHSDLLLRDDSGWLVEWLGQASGNFAANNSATSWLHPAWNVVGVGDYNGDGREDVLLRHEDGTIAEWIGIADGTFLANGAAATNHFDWTWQTQLNPTGTDIWLTPASPWDY